MKTTSITISREKWWKFWTVDKITIDTPHRYTNPYLDESDTLKDSVKDDLCKQIKLELQKIDRRLITKSKKLLVKIHTKETSALGYENFVSEIEFEIFEGEIYFIGDLSLKRHKLVAKILTN